MRKMGTEERRGEPSGVSNVRKMGTGEMQGEPSGVSNMRRGDWRKAGGGGGNQVE